MQRLLSEDLPLRTTRMLGDYAVDAPLAHRYGDLSAARFSLLRLSDSDFFAADHPMTITRVFVDDNETRGWEQATKTDDAGNTWTQVRLAAPAPATASLSACGTGKPNARTGALLENPADIIEDVLRIHGSTEDWSGLRAECAAAGIRLAGSVDTVISARAQLDAITAGAGAIWAGAGQARLYPMETASGRIVALTKADAGGLTVSADLQDRADVLRLSYDREDASGRPQHYIELSARPQRFGGLVQELTLDWLRLPANAEAIGRRILGRLAGERYLVSCKARRKDLRAAGWASLVSHPEWPFDGDPTLMVLRAEVTPGRAAVAIEAEVMREWPTIEVTAHSIALPVTTEGGIDVSVRDGIALFTITDADKKPLKDARVSLDGGLAKKTDERGQVSFVIAQTKGEPKPHELVIEAPGFFSQTLEILL